MIIEVRKKESRRGVLIIGIDGDDWREIHTSIFGQSPNFPDEITSLDEWSEAFHALEYKKARYYALKRLSEKAYYSGELTKSLRERLISPSTIERVIENCRELGFLNDEDWIDAFVRGQIRKRASSSAIAWKLQEKGVPTAQAKRAAREKNSPSNEKESIQHLLNTRYRSRDLQERHEREKVIASLIRKGFQYNSIREAMKVPSDDDYE